MLVNGMCGPYTSLFTNNQSPTSNAGTMLGDGMRYASTRNVRRKRNSSTAPPIPLMLSQSAPGRFAPDFPSRAAATVPLGVAETGAFAFFFLVAIDWASGHGAPESNYALSGSLLRARDKKAP